MNTINKIKYFLLAAVFVLTGCKEEDVAVTGVKLDESSFALVMGDSKQLNATVEPINATNKEVMWKNLNTNVIKVSPDGTVTTLAPGEADVCVITKDGNLYALCKVTVHPRTVTGVTLDQSSITIERSDKAVLTATVSPADATYKNVTWKSSDSEIVEVDDKGFIIGVGVGTARITVTTVDGPHEAYCDVTVLPKPIPVEDVELLPTELTLGLLAGNNTGTLKATVLPVLADILDVTWEITEGADVVSFTESEDEDNTIEVTALKEGTAKITVTTVDGHFPATCTIKVDPEFDHDTYVVKDGDNGVAVENGIKACLANKKRNVTVLFGAGKTYSVGDMDITPGVNNIEFKGASGGAQPLVNVRVNLYRSQANDIIFRNLKIDVESDFSGSGRYIFEANGSETAGRCIYNDLIFEDCSLLNARCIYRANNITVGRSITINRCLIHNMGGYGVISHSNNNDITLSSLQSITVTNSTFTEIRTHFSEVSYMCNITLRNITLCNKYYVSYVTESQRMERLFRYNNVSTIIPTVIVEKCIFAGANANTTGDVISSRPIYAINVDNTGLTFGDSYMTSDLLKDTGQGATRRFVNINDVTESAPDLFVDPDNGDFHIKTGVTFDGKGVAGDPRWW